MGDNVFDPHPSAMVAAINQLTGLVQGLQKELYQVRAQLAHGTSHVQASPSTSSVPAGVPTAYAVDSSQVTEKLKLPQPKTFSSPQHPGAVENCLFECRQYFIGMSVAADKQVFVALSLVDGPLKTWWRHACTTAQTADTFDDLFVWDTFESVLLARFQAVNA
jgi:hypothetical protein